MNRKLTDREQIQVIKFAYLQSINESLERLGVNTLRMTGYDNDNDRVQFINNKKKCTLCFRQQRTYYCRL